MSSFTDKELHAYAKAGAVAEEVLAAISGDSRSLNECTGFIRLIAYTNKKESLIL